MVGFGADLSADLPAIRDLQPGGAILFGRNIHSTKQVAETTSRLAEALPHPPLIALDQEGGRVNRLRPLLGELPTAADLTLDKTRALAAVTAQALTALGFNLDFAPVVDLCTPGTPNGIGDRSFGTDLDRTVALAAAFLAGIQARGVAGCLKHYPGLGDTCVDSHKELPTVTRAPDRDMEPYRRLKTLAAAVMIGHAHYPTLDGETPLPATASPTVVGSLRRLGFDGLIVTDDLEMGAVAARDTDGAMAVAAIEAGCDLVLYCSDLQRAQHARDALVRRATRAPHFRRRLADAAARVAGFAAAWPRRHPVRSNWSRVSNTAAALRARAPGAADPTESA